MNEKTQYCIFSVKGHKYAIRLLDIKEINQGRSITPIFQSSNFISGYMNLRGQIHLVLDLRVMLGHKGLKEPEKAATIILKASVGESFGVLVDSVVEVQEIEQEKIEFHVRKPLTDTRGDALAEALSLGVCHYAGGLVTLLDSSSLLRLC